MARGRKQRAAAPFLSIQSRVLTADVVIDGHLAERHPDSAGRGVCTQVDWAYPDRFADGGGRQIPVDTQRRKP